MSNRLTNQQRVAALVVLGVFIAPSLADDWPAFRGPEGRGITHQRGLPARWSAMENVTWAIDMPMPGNSSPVVWGDRIFITGATGGGAQRHLLCINRDDGQLLWKKTVAYAGQEPTHDTNPYCAATPVTDGRAVYVFHGSAGVFAYDFDGNEIWRRDLGPLTHMWGNASSPLVFEDTVIIHAGPGPRVFLTALDQSTGNVIWKNELKDATGLPDSKRQEDWVGSWSTPILDDANGYPELILSLPGYVASFNPQTGREYWRCNGLTNLVYASPLVGRNVIIAMSGYHGSAIGLRRPGPDARGDVTDTHRLWRNAERNPQRIGSGVLIGEHIFMVNAPGIAECIVAATGESLWKERVGKETWGSTIYADGRLYITDNTGATHVFSPSPAKFTLVASNDFGAAQVTRATPAFSDGQIIIRTYDKLYCIGQRQQRAAFAD